MEDDKKSSILRRFSFNKNTDNLAPIDTTVGNLVTRFDFGNFNYFNNEQKIQVLRNYADNLNSEFLKIQKNTEAYKRNFNTINSRIEGLRRETDAVQRDFQRFKRTVLQQQKARDKEAEGRNEFLKLQKEASAGISKKEFEKWKKKFAENAKKDEGGILNTVTDVITEGLKYGAGALGTYAAMKSGGIAGAMRQFIFHSLSKVPLGTVGLAAGGAVAAGSILAAIMANETRSEALAKDVENAKNEIEKLRAAKALTSSTKASTSRTVDKDIQSTRRAVESMKKTNAPAFETADTLLEHYRLQFNKHQSTQKRNELIDEMQEELDKLGLNEREKQQIKLKFPRGIQNMIDRSASRRKVQQRRSQRKSKKLDTPAAAIGPGPQQLQAAEHKRSAVSTPETYNRMKTIDEKKRFLMFGDLTEGFRIHSGIAASPGNIAPGRFQRFGGGGGAPGGGYTGSGGMAPSGTYKTPKTNVNRTSTPNVALGLPPIVGAPGDTRKPTDVTKDPRLGSLIGGALVADPNKMVQTEGTSKNVLNVPHVDPKTGKKTPASVRYNNPGAAYPRKRDELFGLEGYGIIGGGHKIGKYPTRVQGLASNMDLFSTSKNYLGKSLGAAVSKWRGGNTGQIPSFTLSDGTKIDSRTVITPELVQNREFMTKIFTQFAQWESGVQGTISPQEIAQAFDIKAAGGINPYKEQMRTKQGGKNFRDPEGLKKAQDVLAQAEKNPEVIVGKAAEGEIATSSKAVDIALTQLGLHERKDRQQIKAFLAKGGKGVDPAQTPWCADFLNATLAQAGIKGTGSLVASSFMKWGDRVTDPSKIRKGDVVVRQGVSPGQTGSHVEIATGPAFKDDNGNWMIPTVGGNVDYIAVKEKNRPFGKFQARRAKPEYFLNRDQWGKKDNNQEGPAGSTGPKGPADKPEITMRVNQLQSRVAGTRKGELDPQLVTKLNYAANKVGVEIDVVSGGQRMPGAPGAVGTREHDKGGAADFDIFIRDKDGNRIRLDQDNPEHAPIIENFTREAGRAGIRSAGTDYMGSGSTRSSRIHMGISRNNPLAYSGRKSFKDAWRVGYNDFRQGRGPEDLSPYSAEGIAKAAAEKEKGYQSSPQALAEVDPRYNRGRMIANQQSAASARLAQEVGMLKEKQAEAEEEFKMIKEQGLTPESRQWRERRHMIRQDEAGWQIPNMRLAQEAGMLPNEQKEALQGAQEIVNERKAEKLNRHVKDTIERAERRGEVIRQQREDSKTNQEVPAPAPSGDNDKAPPGIGKPDPEPTETITKESSGGADTGWQVPRSGGRYNPESEPESPGTGGYGSYGKCWV